MKPCDHENLEWDDVPDYSGCHGYSIGAPGTSMYWFGYCEDCKVMVRQRFVPQRVEIVP